MRRSTIPLLVTGLAAAFAALTADVLAHGPIRHVDWWLHAQVDGHLHGGFAWVLGTAMSLLGRREIVVVPLVVLAGFAARRYRSLRPLLVSLGVLVGVAIVVLTFKGAVGRVAPSSGRDAIHAGGASFPSGHAIDAVVCWGLVLEFLVSVSQRAERALGRSRRRIITAAVALAAGVGMIVLDYHWFSDVIAGWVLGTLVLWITLAVGPVPRRMPATVTEAATVSPATPPG